MFHISLLHLYNANNDTMFPNRAQPEPYDFRAPDDQGWFVDEIPGQRWTRNGQLELEVWWSLGDTTWEGLENFKHLEVLEQYLELQGINHPAQLPQQL